MSGTIPPSGSSALNEVQKTASNEILLSRTRTILCGLLSNKTLLWLLTILLIALATSSVMAQNAANPNIAIPRINIGIGRSNNPKDVAVTLQILFLLTILTLAPSILIMTTSFTRIIIVLSIMRSALGVPTIPPNQVLISLALFMTFFIMRPTFTQINDNALQPYFGNKITFQSALNRAQIPMRSFMIRQTYTKDLELFVNLAHLSKPPQSINDIPTTVIIPAFITSELKTAFIIGFYIYLPFLIIDMVVASTLMSMGMMMLPPTVISLPAKLLLFVLANGWNLLLGSLAKGFR